MVMALTMIMAVVSLPAGLGSALEPGTAQAAAADNWASDVAEFESYGNKGWTETGIDVPKWSGNNAASNKDTGDPKTDAFVKPKPGSAETVRYKAINVAADSTLTLPVEETAEVQYYEIYFPEQLRWAITNQKSFRLMNDLDMNGRESRTWSTANLSNKVFMDGNGHTIYNLNTTDGGLIGTWTQPIIAKEIKVVSARMQSGLFTGASRGSSTYISMEGVRLEHALIQSGGFGGGLIGAFYYRPSGSYGRVYASNCHTKNVYVNGSGCSGNIFGPISGFVENCYAIDGTVRTNTHSGAFTSCAGNYIIKDCFTDSNLNHTGIYLYSKGKIMIHLTFDYKTDEKCTTPGQYLKYHRTFQGLTTRELAEKVGIVPATLVLYENDRHPIKHDIAVALANTLGIDRNRLLDEYTTFVDYPYSSLLKKVRHELSLTQMQMAEVIGIGQTTYSGWEREARVPRRKEHDKILAALKKLKVNVDTYLCQSTSI